jgi:hypothetical protein
VKIARLILVSAAAAALGCATVGGYRSWPPLEAGTSPAARSAVLFRFNVQANMGDFRLDYVRFYFPTHQQAAAHVSVDEWASFDVPATGINLYPYTPLLLPLPPGDYYACQVQVYFTGNAQHMATTLMDGVFNTFRVRPGKITTLGQLNVMVTNQVVSVTSAGRNVNTTIDQKVDDSIDTRLDVLDEALSRPEAAPRGWDRALRAARAETAGEGDFFGPFFLKSWPSRADAKVAAAHPPTAALLRLKIDDTLNAYPIRSVTVWFRRAEEAHASDSGLFQRINIPGGRLNRFPYDLLLVPLSPGSYASTTVQFTYNGSQIANVTPKGPVATFEVRPGQVTVLGTLDLKFHAKAMTFPDGRTGTQATTEVGAPATVDKSGTLAAALKRPEAASLGWSEALQAAGEQAQAP